MKTEKLNHTIDVEIFPMIHRVKFTHTIIYSGRGKMDRVIITLNNVSDRLIECAQRASDRAYFEKGLFDGELFTSTTEH